MKWKLKWKHSRVSSASTNKKHGVRYAHDSVQTTVSEMKLFSFRLAPVFNIFSDIFILSNCALPMSAHHRSRWSDREKDYTSERGRRVVCVCVGLRRHKGSWRGAQRAMRYVAIQLQKRSNLENESCKRPGEKRGRERRAAARNAQSTRPARGINVYLQRPPPLSGNH